MLLIRFRHPWRLLAWGAASAGVLIAITAGACATAPQNHFVPKQCGRPGDEPCRPAEFCMTPMREPGPGGVCTYRPRRCVGGGPPVCGRDGRTYPNGCEAMQAGVSIASIGVCAT